MGVAVAVSVSVSMPVIVAALVSGNDAVGVIGSVDDQGPIRRVSMATMRSSRPIPRVCPGGSNDHNPQ